MSLNLTSTFAIFLELYMIRVASSYKGFSDGVVPLAVGDTVVGEVPPVNAFEN